MTDTPATVGGDLPPYIPGNCQVARCLEKGTHTPVVYVWPVHLKPMERADKNGMPIRLGVLCCAGHREIVQRDIRAFMQGQIPKTVPKMYAAMGWEATPDAENFRVYMLDLEDADLRAPLPRTDAEARDLREAPAPAPAANDNDAEEDATLFPWHFACPACGHDADDGFHTASLDGKSAVSCENCDHVFIPENPADGHQEQPE